MVDRWIDLGLDIFYVTSTTFASDFLFNAYMVSIILPFFIFFFALILYTNLLYSFKNSL